MKRQVFLACLIVGLCMQASAHADAPDADTRIVTVPYEAGETVRIRGAIGNSQTILLAPGERVIEVVADDLDAFDISLSGTADAVVFKPLRASASPGISVRTNLRSYAFSIDLGPANLATYLTRFRYGPDPATAPPEASQGTYRLSGTPELRPRSVRDNGVHTYLEWAPEQVLPAVFAINSLGKEEMVDGYMRDGIFTVDRVYTRLVFRFGRKWARAERRPRRD